MKQWLQYKRRFLLTAVWMVIGTVLVVLGILEVIDSFWSGMGGGLVGVSIVQMVRFYRYHSDAQYREDVDVQNNDERNRFLAGKAWAWAGYLFVMINAVAMVVLKLMGYDDQSQWAAYSVCLIVLLYWLSYLFLKKKY